MMTQCISNLDVLGGVGAGNSAERTIFKLLQTESFPTEYVALTEKEGIIFEIKHWSTLPIY